MIKVIQNKNRDSMTLQMNVTDPHRQQSVAAIAANIAAGKIPGIPAQIGIDMLHAEGLLGQVAISTGDL